MEQLNRIELRGVVGNVRIQTFDESRKPAEWAAWVKERVENL